MVYLDLIKLNCELIQDHDFNQAVLETNGLLLRYLPTRFRENRELVKLAVQQNGMALRCAKADLRDNTTVVHLALQQNGLALEFASAKLRADANTVLIAVIENGNAIMHCERSLREDLRKSLHLWTQALSNAPEAKRWLPYEFYSNPGIKAALETSAIKLTKPQQPINIIDDYFSNQPTSHETNALSPTPLTKHTLAHHTEQKKSNRDYLDDWAEKENKKSRSKSNNTVTTSSHKHYSH